MDPKKDVARRKSAQESIRKSMSIMLEAEKLETELFLNPGKMKSKNKLLIEERFNQIIREQKEEDGKIIERELEAARREDDGE